MLSKLRIPVEVLVKFTKGYNSNVHIYVQLVLLVIQLSIVTVCVRSLVGKKMTEDILDKFSRQNKDKGHTNGFLYQSLLITIRMWNINFQILNKTLPKFHITLSVWCNNASDRRSCRLLIDISLVIFLKLRK